MRDRIDTSNSLESGSTTEAALNLASIIGLGAVADFRSALSAMNPDTNVSRPWTAVSDFNGTGSEIRREDGQRVRTYEGGGRAQWDRQNRLIQMTDRAGHSFELTYEGNAMQPSRIQVSNGLDVSPDRQLQAVVNHEIGMIEMTHVGGLGVTYFLNGNSIEHREDLYGRITTSRSYNPGDGSLITSVQRPALNYSEDTTTRRDGTQSRVRSYPCGRGGNGQPEIEPLWAQFPPGAANPTYTTMENGQSHQIQNVRDISYSEGSFPGVSNLRIRTHDGRHFFVSDVGAGGNAASVHQLKKLDAN